MDSRRHDREPLTLAVEYEGAEDLLGDFTENLSLGGTFVRTTRVFELGTEVHLLLSFAGLLRPIPVSGVVRWVREGDEPGVGIEFSEGQQTVIRLAALMESIRQSDPSVVGRVIRLLVVEDNPHVAQLISQGLRSGTKRKFGDSVSFHFETASDGREALDLLAEQVFDALLIDVYMPVVDGPTVIRKVRADERLGGLPIIAVSAGGKPAREAALEAGADFFLEKPMRLREIVESMSKLMTIGPPTSD